MDLSYIETVRLLLDAAPEVFRSDVFAMKGGTAINLFVQDMPRLSVDIDVVYVPLDKPREAVFAEIAAELDDLQAARSRLRAELLAALTESQKRFLLSLVSGEPEWALLSITHLERLPAVQWKLQNLARLKKMNPTKFRAQVDELAARFG